MQIHKVHACKAHHKKNPLDHIFSGKSNFSFTQKNRKTKNAKFHFLKENRQTSKFTIKNNPNGKTKL